MSPSFVKAELEGEEVGGGEVEDGGEGDEDEGDDEEADVGTAAFGADVAGFGDIVHAVAAERSALDGRGVDAVGGGDAKLLVYTCIPLLTFFLFGVVVDVLVVVLPRAGGFDECELKHGVGGGVLCCLLVIR